VTGRLDLFSSPSFWGVNSNDHLSLPPSGFFGNGSPDGCEFLTIHILELRFAQIHVGQPLAPFEVLIEYFPISLQMFVELVITFE
jgi:hypothetical protein